MTSLLFAQEGERFVQELLEWFKAHQRELPWRLEYAPYHVWISEIMGQQTQMERVVVYFQRWVRALPTPKAVAEAPEELILKLWEGLGYYSRARNIQRAARVIEERHDGVIPRTYDELLALPGVGPYTAAAIGSIAFELDLPLLDANVERLLARILDSAEDVRSQKTKARFRGILSGLLPRGQARAFNQALMEFGALVCLPKGPRCRQCPFSMGCLAFSRGTIAQRPVPRMKKTPVRVHAVALVVVSDLGVMIRKRGATGLWANLWELPTLEVAKAGAVPEGTRLLLEELGIGGLPTQRFPGIDHAYTNHRATLYPSLCLVSGEGVEVSVGFEWCPIPNLGQLAFPSAHARALRDTLLEPQNSLITSVGSSIIGSNS